MTGRATPAPPGPPAGTAVTGPEAGRAGAVPPAGAPHLADATDPVDAEHPADATDPVDAVGAAGVVPDGPHPPTPAPRWVLPAKIVGALALIGVAVLALQGKVPTPDQVWASLSTANGWGIAAAAVVELASLAEIVRQQRRLLRAFGVPIGFRRLGAITWSSNALAMSLPAGAAVSAGYTYREFRRNGAAQGTAVTVLLLSGVMSTVGLGLLYAVAVGLLASPWVRDVIEAHPVVSVTLAILLAVAVHLGLRLIGRSKDRVLSTDPTPRLDRLQERRPRLASAFRQLLTTARQARTVRFADWRVVLAASVANWALDLACLWASCLAVGIHIHPAALAAIYLGMQLVRQIPLTPGGLGVVEAALLAGLVHAGAANGPAAAAVLIYRLLSTWLLIPIGYLVLGVMHRRDGRSRPPSPTRPAGSAPTTTG
ncbi:flippase-like domain-containing protein [Nakamurella flavida]|uniref:Flippase-like domain-containing protein n=1 Tax=Nakamurella flavida TaxID=363630 RepID=A0A938YEU5_9ACTN|nr:lysylphosphatidylglycerol synthase transmembrane domain-containing protein [Nakamurella flavida]MBM9476376.1 flippase-like domain-containing protein [Nakamurella flavida]MDP9779524.1 uncharacterized protein (TIRG00374 family) [Nakamurella flavida]